MNSPVREKGSLTLAQVAEVLNAEALVEPEGWKEVVIKGACGSDLMSDVLTHIKPDCLLLTGLTNPQVIKTSEIADIRAICFVRGKRPAEEIVRLAQEKNMPLFATGLPMFESCGKLFSSGLRGISEIGE